MKLTKKILKKLIKEELSGMTNELMLPGSPKHKEMIRSARAQAREMGYDLDSKKDVQLKANIVSTNDYQFDYKTGVVQFLNSDKDPVDADSKGEEIPDMQATLRYLRTRLSSLSNPRQY